MTAPAYAGTGALLRVGLRRDRRRLLIWVVALGLLTVYAAVALTSVYPTAADRQARAAAVDTPAGILFTGPAFGVDDYTTGAMVANELGLSVMVAVAVMSILLVVRHTRAEEESGGTELLLSGAVGRRTPLTTALALMAAANVAIAVVVAAGLLGAGLGTAGSLALAAGFALTGMVFGAVAAVTAQLFQTGRAASGAALGVLLAAVLVRGIGDVLQTGGSPLSWFSPIAWAQQTRAFVDLRWWPLLLSVALIAVLLAVAARLTARRDVGAGVFAPRRGPAEAAASLSGPVGLAARLQRGAVAGWAAGLLVLALSFGSLTDQVTDMIAGNPQLAEVFAAGGADPADSFSAVAALYHGLLAGGFAVGSVLRLRGEETGGRAELLLSTALDRRRYAGATLGVAGGAAALLLLVAGAAGGLAAAGVIGDAGQFGRQLGAALVQLPAVLVLAGLTAALVGWAPRWAPLAWAVLVWALLAGMFGELLSLPGWAVRLSPFGWVPQVPAEALEAGPLLGLLAVALALGAAALVGFRRRDVPA
ncbi:ABC transporter permease [Geodermatophilus sp. SYSU D00815]